MFESLRAGKRVTLDVVWACSPMGSRCGGVGEGGHFRLARQYVDEIVLVTNGPDLLGDRFRIFFKTRAPFRRPAGRGWRWPASKSTSARENCTETPGSLRSNCGANMNFDRSPVRGGTARNIGAQREALFAVQIPEAPGSFLEILRSAGQSPASPSSNYRFGDLRAAQIFVGLAARAGQAGRR